MKAPHIRCSEKIHTMIKIAAAGRGMSMQDFVEMIVIEYARKSGDTAAPPGLTPEDERLAAQILDVWHDPNLSEMENLMRKMLEDCIDRRDQSHSGNSKTG